MLKPRLRTHISAKAINPIVTRIRPSYVGRARLLSTKVMCFFYGCHDASVVYAFFCITGDKTGRALSPLNFHGYAMYDRKPHGRGFMKSRTVGNAVRLVRNM